MKQELTYGTDGELLHTINDTLRAVVPAAHVEDYCIEIGVELPTDPAAPIDSARSGDQDGRRTD